MVVRCLLKPKCPVHYYYILFGLVLLYQKCSRSFNNSYTAYGLAEVCMLNPEQYKHFVPQQLLSLAFHGFQDSFALQVLMYY